MTLTGIAKVTTEFTLSYMVITSTKSTLETKLNYLTVITVVRIVSFLFELSSFLGIWFLGYRVSVISGCFVVLAL